MANYGELSLLEQARAPQDSRGAAVLGAVLGGGGARRAQMYNQGALSGAHLADVLAQARQRQQAEIGRQANYHAALARGDNDMANMFLYANPNEIADYEGKHQKTGYTKQAWENATSPTHDDNLLNRMLSVVEGKPQVLTKIEGDTVLNPSVTPDSQRLQTTDLGRAIISEKGAQAHSAMTAAGLHEAEAEAARALTANRNAERPFIGPKGSQKGFSEHEAAAAIGTGPDGKLDPARFRAFEDLKAKAPGMSDTQALEQFRNTYDDDPAAAAAQNIGPPVPNDGIMARLFGSGDSSAPAGPAHVGDSPHPEGTKLMGPDGKLYIVKNGQPVLAQ